MSKTLSINATKRELLGKGPAGRYRRQGLIPVVMYGHGDPAVNLLIEESVAKSILGHAGVVEVKCDGETSMTVLKDHQIDPISTRILHLDLLHVSADEMITSLVPIQGEGEAAGLKMGGQLEQVMMEIEVKSLPTDVPDVLIVDVSGIEMDSALHVRDLVMPQGVTPVADGDLIVFHVRAPRTAAVEEPVAAEEGAEDEKKDDKKDDKKEEKKK
jgi:large subunit ribosomal protein L25